MPKSILGPALRSLFLFGWLAALTGCSGDAQPTGPDQDPYPYPVGKVFFSHPPVGLEGVFFFESMGALYTPFQEDHVGFFHDELFGGGTAIPVIAPGAGPLGTSLDVRIPVGWHLDGAAT